MALPVAMLALVILAALTIAFSVLSASEPVIANNHLMGSQARVLAEAGVERAIWGLQNGPDSRGIPVTGAVPTPYDGRQLISVRSSVSNVGGFRITVTSGGEGCMSLAERCITAVGWVPSDIASGPRSHRMIAVTAGNPQLLYRDPPAAMSARGALQISGASHIDASSDRSCDGKAGAVVSGSVGLDGPVVVRGGADGNDIPNEMIDANRGPVPPGAGDIVANAAADALDRFMWSDSDIKYLRAYARTQGHYYRGNVTFDSSNKMPDGLVFVDTASGANAGPATPDADYARVDVRDGAASDASGIVSGWLFVNGALSINSGFRMNGLIYVQDDIRYHGTPGGGIAGAVIVRNIRDLSSAGAESNVLSDANITYNCVLARTGGHRIPSRWSTTPGTYRELCDSCTS